MIIKRGDVQPITAVLTEDLDFNEEKVKLTLATLKKKQLKQPEIKKEETK